MDFHKDPQYQIQAPPARSYPMQSLDEAKQVVRQNVERSNTTWAIRGVIALIIVGAIVVFGLSIARASFESLSPDPIDTLLSLEYAHIDATITQDIELMGATVEQRVTGDTTFFVEPSMYSVRQTTQSTYDASMSDKAFEKFKEEAGPESQQMSSEEEAELKRVLQEQMSGLLKAMESDQEFRKTAKGAYRKINKSPLLGTSLATEGRWINDTYYSLFGAVSPSGTGSATTTRRATTTIKAEGRAVTKEELQSLYQEHPFLVPSKSLSLKGKTYDVDAQQFAAFVDGLKAIDPSLVSALRLEAYAKNAEKHTTSVTVAHSLTGKKITDITIVDEVDDPEAMAQNPFSNVRTKAHIAFSEINQPFTVDDPTDVLSETDRASQVQQARDARNTNTAKTETAAPSTNTTTVASTTEWTVGTYSDEGDADSDGLSDIQEDGVGSDPQKADTDGDGYNDRIEVEKGFSPTQANSSVQRRTPNPADTRRNNAVGFLARTHTFMGLVEGATKCPEVKNWNNVIENVSAYATSIQADPKAQLLTVQGIPHSDKRPLSYVRAKDGTSCFFHVDMDAFQQQDARDFPGYHPQNGSYGQDAYQIVTSNGPAPQSISCGGASACYMVRANRF